MSRRFPERVRGFSLTEAMVSLTLLVVVMVVALTLLFTMRSFAERTQFLIEPRQTARRAADYLSYFLQGATDLNGTGTAVVAPNALVTYYNRDASDPGSRVQASYNNLTGTETGNSVVAAGRTAFGDVGSDIISLILPTGRPAKYAIAVWPADGLNQDLYLAYRDGCGPGATNDDAANMLLFRQLTREVSGESTALLLAQDNNGAWQYLRINSYVAANPPADGCQVTNGQNLHVTISPGQAPASGGPIDVPGGHVALATPAFLYLGLEAFSFRVRTDANGNVNLEQKSGLFDPLTDNPGAAFAPIIENIEDLQIAYIYPDGTAWNTAAQDITAGCAACVNGVPWQAGVTAVAPARDIQNVIGLRFSVVGRSRPISFGARQISAPTTGATGSTASRRFRPAVEDRAAAAAYDQSEHYRATGTLMLKNRMLGN